MTPLVLYFGVKPGDRAGHFLWTVGGSTVYPPDPKAPGFPWRFEHLDGGLLGNRQVPDVVDGRVHWTCGARPAWIAFFWWDRSGDARGASNSGFYVSGFDPTTELKEAFEFACSAWPAVVARQAKPLVIVDIAGRALAGVGAEMP